MLNLPVKRVVCDIQPKRTSRSGCVLQERASVEPLFDQTEDARFDLDLVENAVELTRRQYARKGEARSWLISEAFDMKSGYSIEAESALNDEQLSNADAAALEQRLRAVLSDTDPFWMRWRFVSEKKGW